EQIKSVEVITSPSAKYDAEGSGGIINIITKKSNAQGVSGSISGAAGIRQNNGAFNLTAKTGRLSVNSSLGGNYAYPQKSIVNVTNQSFVNNIKTSEITQNGYSNWNRNGINGSVGMDYDFNAYNNISSNLKVNRFNNGGPGESDYVINGVPAKNISDMNMSFNNLDWNVDYKKTTKNEGEEFSISGQISTGRTPNFFSNNLAGVLVETNNTGKNNEYTIQADYTYPFNKTTSLEIGGKGIFRDIKSQFNVAARDFNYNQNVAGAYGILSFNLTKSIQVKGGLRAENTEINWLSADNSKTKNNYFNLFPSVIISRNLKGGTTLKASYNRRIQRPTLSFLNPFRNESSQFSIIQGNPGLAPELSDNYELAYSTFIKGSIINASAFYRRTGGIIESFVSGIKEAGVDKLLTSYTNVGVSETYGFNIFGSYNPMPKWTLMSNVGLNTYEVNNKATGINTGTLINYTAFGRSAYAFGKGYNFELFGVINSPRRTFQGETKAMFFYGGSLKKEILKKKGSIGINVLNPFHENLNIRTTNQSTEVYQFTDIYYPLRSIGINFSYSFGKLKFVEKKKIKNDDAKQGESQGGGMGGGN
ncbi:MAG: outer membrane beta-barrel family protein, partial [Sphingobacteriaceae bacterium]|nr:outer membrane beta-barrel family protein [Sphingobacteriaceae bacterium]